MKNYTFLNESITQSSNQSQLINDVIKDIERLIEISDDIVFLKIDTEEGTRTIVSKKFPKPLGFCPKFDSKIQRCYWH